MPVDFSKSPKTLSVASTQFGSMFPFHPPLKTLEHQRFFVCRGYKMTGANTGKNFIAQSAIGRRDPAPKFKSSEKHVVTS